MADNPRTRTLRLVEPDEPPLPGPLDIDFGNQGTNPFSVQDGVGKTENADGSLTVDFNPNLSPKKEGEDDFYRNIADDIEASELSRIASELISGIDLDNQSRQEWLQTRARGITLLGLKLEEPRGDISSSAGNLEGMSSVRHPLLLESTLRFQANARGELLPASGPVKVRNDTPTPPKVKPAPPPVAPAGPPAMGHNGGPPMDAGAPPMPPMPVPMPPQGGPQMGGPPQGPVGGGAPPPGAQAPPPPAVPPPVFEGGFDNSTEELASALEADMNHYLTAIATEYYPDTDRMLFWVGAGGQGIKKVYNCPIRQRPVSESVDAEDIIVSNAATNLENCGRVTHRIKMRPSTLKRMQMIGAYRDVFLSSAPAFPMKDPVQLKKDEISGIRPQLQSQQDAEHEIYEVYCELDIAGFEHKDGKEVTGLQCPYKVTIHKESRQVLEVRRNWEEDDKLCMPKRFFVDFPFVRAMGFYGIGLIHITGNTTTALTAAWREMLDAGMFASFPGFIYDKSAGRQLTNQFRVPPGGGIPIDVGPNGRIQDRIMPLPYKEPGGGFTSFIAHIEEVGQRVAGTAEVNVGEGNQEVPVGTTLALIEQATKVMDAVHKRLHAAQAQEFQLLKERFQEDPEAFWRHNKRPTIPWKKEQFLQALDNCDLVPVADPNNPTSLHRIAKATAIKALQQANPAIYDAIGVDTRIMRIVGIDPEGLFNQNPQAAPPDPRLIAAMGKEKAEQMRTEMARLKTQIDLQIKQMEFQDSAAERFSREKVANLQLELERMRLMEARIIHNQDLEAETIRHIQALEADIAKSRIEINQGRQESMAKLASEHIKHGRELEHRQQEQERDIEGKKEIVRMKPKPAPKG